MRRDVFQAIADPTRREIISMISKGSLNINAVSEHFEVSRTAVYKHIKILTQCGLVSLKQHGREKYCEPRLEGLSAVSDWVEQYRKMWTERLDALENYLQKLQAASPPPASAPALTPAPVAALASAPAAKKSHANKKSRTNKKLQTKNKKNAKGKTTR